MLDLLANLHHLSLDTVINLLRLAIDFAKFRRDRFKNPQAPERVEEVLTQAEQASTIDAAEIDRQLAHVLDPADAAIVKSDLELLSLLMVPAPLLDAFDYWGILTKLVAALQTFAIQNRIFEIRGKRTSIGETLTLSKAGAYILPMQAARNLPEPSRDQSLKTVEATALLHRESSGFPIWLSVHAIFNQYYAMGGPPGQEHASCLFKVLQGQKANWLKFERFGFNYQFAEGGEYMLNAQEFEGIVKALADDVHDYAEELKADEERIRPLLAAIDTFAKGRAR